MDPRPGGRHRAQQRGLAGVGGSHQAHVGDQLELQPEPPLLALQPRLRDVRRLLDRAAEVHVTAAADPATGHDSVVAWQLACGACLLAGWEFLGRSGGERWVSEPSLIAVKIWAWLGGSRDFVATVLGCFLAGVLGVVVARRTIGP